MKRCIIIIYLMSAGGAWAQAAPAQRYMDDQGVEIIQNRAAPPRPAVAVVAAREPAPGPAQTTADPRLRIGQAEQAARDRDREAVLREELGQETRKFEAATKALAQAEHAARSQPQAAAILKQLKEVLHAHQQNILSLHAELQRNRIVR